jgi:hypothetical protein
LGYNNVMLKHKGSNPSATKITTSPFTLEQATKAQSGSRGIVIFFFNLGARWRWVVNATPWPLYPQEGDPVPIL